MSIPVVLVAGLHAAARAAVAGRLLREHPGSVAVHQPRRTVRKKGSPLHGVGCIDDKDTDLLRKFISDRGKIRRRRVTGVTVRQQRRLARATKNAREMALLS